MSDTMYQSHFGLREAPFGITPDTAFVYDCRAHQEALNVVLVALDSGEGFIKITGDVGTGKTLLCRRAMSVVEKNFSTAYLPNPLLDPRGLLIALADEFAVKMDRRADGHQLVRSLTQALLKLNVAGRRPVVFIDEAQAMSLPTLETMRLLSNLETEKHKLMQVVLFGQPELDRHLANPAVRQLRQRITFEYRISELTRVEVRHYLAHRMRVAGYAGPQAFSPAALGYLHRATGGVPRLVNVLAHKALMLVFAEGRDRVTLRHAIAAARDTSSARRALIPWIV